MPILGGFGYGSGGISKAVVGSTSGLNTSRNVTVNGLPAVVYEWLGSGTITFVKAGLVDILLIGPGGAAGVNCGSGGAGGYVLRENVFVPAASESVIIGAGYGGATISSNFSGSSTAFRGIYAICGGSGSAYYDRSANSGASGGGGGAADGRSVFIARQGFDGVEGQGVVGSKLKGGFGSAGGCGGGGGAAGNGSDRVGGASVTTDFGGFSGTYCRGGGLNAGGTGQANTGNGGSNGSGGSGRAFIRVFQ